MSDEPVLEFIPLESFYGETPYGDFPIVIAHRGWVDQIRAAALGFECVVIPLSNGRILPYCPGPLSLVLMSILDIKGAYLSEDPEHTGYFYTSGLSLEEWFGEAEFPYPLAAVLQIDGEY